MKTGYRAWSEADVAELRRLLGAGERDEVIASALGRSVAAVQIRRLRDCRDLMPAIDFEAVTDARERWGHGKHPLYWTAERCAAALRAYARRTTGRLPISHAYDVVKSGDPALPPSARLRDHWGSLTRAWLAVLPDSQRHRVPPLGCAWTPEEDEKLVALAGSRTLKEIGALLHRTWPACKRRLYDLGTRARDAAGYMNATQVAHEYGCPVARVQRLIKQGHLPARKRVASYLAIDPEDAMKVAHLLRAPKHGQRKPEPPTVITRYQQHRDARAEVLRRVQSEAAS